MNANIPARDRFVLKQIYSRLQDYGVDSKDAHMVHLRRIMGPLDIYGVPREVTEADAKHEAILSGVGHACSFDELAAAIKYRDPAFKTVDETDAEIALAAKHDAITVNEIRALRGYPPLSGGDVPPSKFNVAARDSILANRTAKPAPRTLTWHNRDATGRITQSCTLPEATYPVAPSKDYPQGAWRVMTNDEGLAGVVIDARDVTVGDADSAASALLATQANRFGWAGDDADGPIVVEAK